MGSPAAPPTPEPLPPLPAEARVDQTMQLGGRKVRYSAKVGSMYQGDHMFYSRADSRDALRADVQAMFARH